MDALLPGGIGLGQRHMRAQRAARLACRERCEFIPSLNDASRVAVDRAKALAKDCRPTFGPLNNGSVPA